jgi:hypothetical protein
MHELNVSFGKRLKNEYEKFVYLIHYYDKLISLTLKNLPEIGSISYKNSKMNDKIIFIIDL